MPVAGGRTGNSLGAAISKWLGSGDYSVGSNSVVKSSMKAAGSIPAMHTDNQTVVIRHKEYLGEIRSAQSYTVQNSYPLNPGMAVTFPWLANIANSFQEYKIKGLVFHYIPSSGYMASTTSPALGTVMLQTSYRSTDSAPASKVELLNEFWSNEVVPSETMVHPIECDPKENPFNVQYVRSGAIPTTDTQLMYDLGVTHVAVSGCQVDDKVLGDLWITYEIELKKPLVSSNVTTLVDAAYLETTTGTSSSSFFGVGTMRGTIPVVVSGTSNSTFTFPKGTVGTFAFRGTCDGTALVVAGFTPTYTNCVQAAPFGSSTLTFSTTSSTRYAIDFAITISDPAVQAVVSLNFGGATGSGITGRSCFARIA
jgi:hypothetical protein